MRISQTLNTALLIGASLFSFSTAVSLQAQTADSLALNEVVVTGTRNAVDVRHLPMTVTVLDRLALTEQHQPSILSTVSEQVPGVFVTQRSMMGYGVSGGAAGGINLRGLSAGAGQMLVLIDGHPQYSGIYGHPIGDSYQTLIADRVEVLRGPASVLYGSNAMGGVMNIVTRAMHDDGVRTDVQVGAGSWGTIQAEASNQLRCGKFTSTVAAQYGRTDNHRPRLGFEQYGGYVKLGYDFTEHWNAYVDANITHFNASQPGTVASPKYDADQWITRGVVSAALENHYNKTSGALSVYNNFGRHKIDDGTANPAQPTNRYFRSTDALLGVSLYQSATFFEGNRITVGMDYQHIYGRAYYTDKVTGEEQTTGDVVDRKYAGTAHQNDIAAYVDFRQDLVSWLTVDAGLRMDHHSITGTEWIPQAGIVVRPIDNGEVKFMASKGFRNPTMMELYLYPKSNEDLRPERLWTYELSWKHRVGALSYGLNLYAINGDNMIQVVNQKNVNTGEIKNRGVEVEADYRINSHWRVSTNHSWLHMDNKIIAAPEYKGYLAAHFNHSRWTAMAGAQYLAGLYTNVTPGKEDKTCVFLLNATVGYQVLKQLNVWLRGDNLLAQKYEIIEGYPMPRATFMAGVKATF